VLPGRTRSLLLTVCGSGVALGNVLGLGVTGPLVEATESVFTLERLPSSPRLVIDDLATIDGALRSGFWLGWQL
jgi:hypothetical protein